MKIWKRHPLAQSAPNLFRAAKENDLLGLERFIIEGHNIDAKDERGYSPLMLAAYAGHEEAATILLAHGANPNTTDDAGNSVLMGAAFKGHLAIVQKLVEAGARIEHRNQNGMEAIHFASAFGRKQVCDWLVAHSGRTKTPKRLASLLNVAKSLFK
jgi:ankyrin repeat protein